MAQDIFLHNTLTRKKEKFEPLSAPHVGMYVCGPTVYGEAHLGHARPAITFDVLYRYLTHLGYKVRYVRNITDVGHLEDEVEGTGEDRIAKKARLEQLEPMEVAQQCINTYHESMRLLNVLPPSIEPQASGHILEIQEMIQQILDAGYAYEVNGSIYFDVLKYHEKYHYGTLSGRKVEDLLSNTRSLDNQDEKKNSLDFALWKKAAPEHIMKWNSQWSLGFPGWHLECSAMGSKYLGEVFDIHGGGMDLLFPHHECEIAQSTVANGSNHARYWMHNNMITINGQKMGKSLGNFINLGEFFSGSHKLLLQAYSPMTIRFFILQAHYRGTVDFSNEALQSAEKGYQRLMQSIKVLDNLKPSANTTVHIAELKEKCYNALNDDLNTPILLAQLFEGAKIINQIKSGEESITESDLAEFKSYYTSFIFDILGLSPEEKATNNNELTSSLIEILLQQRLKAKQNKDFATSDEIRDQLQALGVVVKDKKDGFEWEINS